MPADPRIDVPTVLDDLQAVVADKGDGYVYRVPEAGECRYVEDGDVEGHVVPSCIVGHVFARHGLLFRPYSLDNVTLGGMPEEFYDDFTPEAVDVMAAAQEVQDTCRATWGDALIAAKEAAASDPSQGQSLSVVQPS